MHSRSGCDRAARRKSCRGLASRVITSVRLRFGVTSTTEKFGTRPPLIRLPQASRTRTTTNSTRRCPMPEIYSEPANWSVTIPWPPSTSGDARSRLAKFRATISSKVAEAGIRRPFGGQVVLDICFRCASHRSRHPFELATIVIDSLAQECCWPALNFRHFEEIRIRRSRKICEWREVVVSCWHVSESPWCSREEQDRFYGEA